MPIKHHSDLVPFRVFFENVRQAPLSFFMGPPPGNTPHRHYRLLTDSGYDDTSRNDDTSRKLEHVFCNFTCKLFQTCILSKF